MKEIRWLDLDRQVPRSAYKGVGRNRHIINPPSLILYRDIKVALEDFVVESHDSNTDHTGIKRIEIKAGEEFLSWS